ncbi:long-chain fatty acid--CoA ligase [Variovorax sp. J22R133]|uniref:long-chain-fatty-acid--CoA ligase n=1 Tax=Variovorax brevis TaxID=3053503 RepID=UPI00257508D3|nr:long-chain fatty acid--CoA ligase [Variovorax sp. J22R133]MDM0117860.1 long-chain fatty acid--CoA ligase [Variovorax sp. J22R133]
MNELPWLASYPDGVRWDIPIEPAPIQTILDRAAAAWPDNPALQFMGRRMTYGELLAQADRAAKGLQELGVGPGMHVGLYLPNTPHYVIAFFAVLKAGGTVVNYSPLDAAKVLEHKIEDSCTDVLITLDLASLYPQMAAMLGKTRLKKLIVGSMAEMTAAPRAVAAQMQAGKQLAEVHWDDRHLRFEQLLHNDGRYTPHPVTDPHDALAVLQYTGGTTGLPKGAMLTHANLWAACEQYLASVNSNPPVLREGHERFLAVLPPFHIYALSVNMLLGIRLAAELVMHVRFDAEAALRDISDKKITSFCGVPTMFTALINHPDTAKYDLHSLKYCGSGGAPLPLEVAQQFHEVTGTRLNEGWGMTETSPTGTFTPVFGMRKDGSCGMPLPRIEIRMLSLEDKTRYVAPGEKGEICIKGPNVMKGYWNSPDATAEVTTFDGMLRTGDVGYLDEDGFVFIVDRCKDMLLCSGYNVYPRVLEEAIYQHPAVAEVAVIGIPDEYRGQSPKAFITLKAGAPDFELPDLQAFLKDKLGKHEMVQALEIRTELPKTQIGKLSKKDLADEEEARRQTALA